MELIKTNSNKFNELMYNYIINAINTENYNLEAHTDLEKLTFLAYTFKSEYCFEHNLRRYGSIQNTLENWLRGIPSAFDIDFWNSDIVEIAEKWGTISKHAPEHQKNAVVNNWFNLVARHIIKAFDKHNIIVN